MRLFSIRIVAVCVGGFALSACPPDDIVNGVVALGSLPRVCPSNVEVDGGYLPASLKFDPFVHNTGVNDSTTTFKLDMVVKRSDGTVVQGLPFIKQTTDPIIGTHAKPGVTAGPDYRLTSISSLAPRAFPNNPSETYGVTLTISSSDDTFNTANQDCRQLGPIYFRNGQRI